ncbi:multidrug resistance protein [Ophiostoma piceae UAMH 11346]|uniref:Multidrug resistance protein n=1 Tax=Ophiostoma piceae (strain UAMH 11346) TaxID=1262450 RepID=S3C6T6_OPHP1|nr:multidrug resistance protein [Ophiostoma piceae UAMH 11346]
MNSPDRVPRPVPGSSTSNISKRDISYPIRLDTPPAAPVRSVRIHGIEEKPRIVNIEPQSGASYQGSSRRQKQSPTSPQSAFSDISTPADYGRYSQSSQSTRPILSPPSPTSSTVASLATPTQKKKEKAKEQQAGFKHLFVAATKQDISIFIFATAASAAVAAAKTVYALFLGEIFQVVTNFGSGTLTPAETLRQVSKGCLELTVLGIGMSVAASFLMSLWIVNGETRARTVRLRLFRALLDKEMVWFDTRRGGMASLMTEQYTQIRDLQAATSQLLGYIISDLMVCVACVIVAFVKSWALTLILLATVPVSIVILELLGRGLKQAAERQRGALNDAAKHATASLAGIDLVKVYGGHDTELWLYLNGIRKAARHYTRQALSACAQMGYIKVWMINLFVVGFWFGITLVKKGQTTAGNVLTAFYAVLIAFQSLESLGTQWVSVLKGTVAGKSLDEMIVSTSESPHGHGSRYSNIQPRLPPKDIVLDNVTFAYPSNPDNKVLDRCSMRFPSGQVSFVVGRSGSGKSTIADLLVQFYRPTSGRILIDGLSASVIDRRWLRENVALIQQASTIFNGTFGWNIALGASGKGGVAPDAVSRDDIKMACETALLQSTVTNLAQGLDTLVGSRGASLSGGQRQRLALARAKIRNPAVLLLDETTSGLDPKSAQMVLDAVRTWRRGRTTIIITHDISQIAHEDYVYVMEQGRLVQEGSFGWMAQQEGGAMQTLMQSASIDGATAADSLQSPVAKIGHSGDDEDAVDVQVSLAATSSRQDRSTQAASGMFKRTSVFSAPFTYHQIQQQGGSGNVLLNPFPNYRQHSRLFDPVHAPRLQSAVVEADSEDEDDGSEDELFRQRGDSLDLICERGERAQTMRMDDALGSPTSRHGRNTKTIERHRLQPMSVTSESKSKSKSKKLKDSNNSTASDERAVSLMSVLWTVWPTIDRAARLDLVLGSLACLVSAASNPAFSFVFARMLQAFWAPPGVDKQAAGRPWALILVGLSIVDGISIFSSFYLAERVGLAWVNALRTEALTRILRQPKSWWVTGQGRDGDSDSDGESGIAPSTIVECLDRGGEEMRKIVSVFVPILLMAGGMVVVSIVWALAVAWKITLVVLAAGPLIVIAATQVASRISDTWEGRSNRAAEAVSAVFSEVFPNIRVVRALTLEDYFSATQLADTTAAAYRIGLSRAWRTGILYGINQGIPNWLVALVFYYGTTMLTDTASVNALIQVINLLLFSIGSGAGLLGNVPQIAASKTVAAQMLVYATLPLYASHEHQPESESKLRIPSIFPVRMDGLVFRYPTSDTNKSSLLSQPTILRNLSLTLQPGELVGIVGPSGGGKSTVLSLLLRLYADEDVPSKLSFGGLSCSDLDTTSLRSRMAYVPQQPYLFPATVRHNMAYGLREDSPLRHTPRLQEAARAAGIDEFIASLPEGYDTVVGGGASTKSKDNDGSSTSERTAVSSLSGGQAQRVCVARALLRQPQLLVLDEPTSALDASSAETIRQTIRSLVPLQKNNTRSGLSIVVATHSKAMMRLCDRLLVVEDGAVAANGSYEALLRQGSTGVFARLIGEVDD